MPATMFISPDGRLLERRVGETSRDDLGRQRPDFSPAPTKATPRCSRTPCHTNQAPPISASAAIRNNPRATERLTLPRLPSVVLPHRTGYEASGARAWTGLTGAFAGWSLRSRDPHPPHHAFDGEIENESHPEGRKQQQGQPESNEKG